MSDNITVRGFVATEIKSSTTPGGVATASFRLGSTARRYDRASNTWVDGHTNWFTVQGYRQLAGNMGCSIKKGQRVIIVGRLKLRSWEKEGRIYHAVEIDAESVGHDLKWGSANFMRNAGNGGQLVLAGDAAEEGSPGHASEPGSPDGDDPLDNEGDDEESAAGVFVDGTTGETLHLDPDTGELMGAVA